MKQLEMFIDGASQGNPGHSGIGVIIIENGQPIKNISRYIGNATNNVAEYTALIDGLKELMRFEAEHVTINTDSQLLCRQINKEYKVRNEHIYTLYAQAVDLLSNFKRFSVRHIPRTQNAAADKLATQAIKEALREK